MRVDSVTPCVVELAPAQLKPGTLYISYKYSTALHLCCCGCGEKVVTPLSPAEWQVQVQNGLATLYPSIGNWSMPCQSHYWIKGNKVVWAAKLSKRKIAAVHKRDLHDLEVQHAAVTRPVEQPKAAAEPPARKVSWLERLWNFLFGE